MKLRAMLATLLFLSIVQMPMALAQSEEASLVFAADMLFLEDSKLGSYAQLATILENQRKLNRPSWFLFGGGSLGPSAMSSFDRGSHIIDVLNSLEPDAMGTSKREFSFFEDELSLRAYEAAFPIVVSNLVQLNDGSPLDGIVSSTVIEKVDQKIGILSIVDASVIEEYLLSRVRVQSPCDSIKRHADVLRKQGADVIVVMYSEQQNCYQSLYDKGVADLFLRSIVEGADDPDLVNNVKANNFGLLSKGTVLLLDLQWDRSIKNSLEVKHHYLRLNAFEKNAAVDLQVAEYNMRTERLLNQDIGTISTPFNTYRATVRGKESAFANFVADSLKQHTGSDIAIINGGSIRGDTAYEKNHRITRKDIAHELPYRSRVVVRQVSGQSITKALESALSNIAVLEGRFPQVSGIELVFDSSAPKGERVKNITINGQALNPNQQYSLATTDYLAGGGDGYTALRNALPLDFNHQITPLVSNILISAIQSQTPVKLKVEGRLIDVSTLPKGQL